ncbi:hypothetical protein Ferp_1008 [Ferroglobus placidus DSM 10642]|uniref:Cytoplasmic chaperone TorD family protein n=1 Tax=Ferroglobus placidus (strain DSM 10642 / AEDII12DO) TaxID=589924 RepID=D3RXF7_FERPA|nr:molecular chaperone TorD family protein [Ferroglobus placidus]ADC65170.1 hypothetical protein Ferp_1008 [Ferroglobus placidus DSM 10642]
MNLREILEFRRDFYRFLSSLFSGEIPEDFVRDLAEKRIDLPRNPDIVEGFRILEEFVARRGVKEAVKAIQNEFATFFSGLSSEIPTTKSEVFGEGAYGKISLEVEEKMREFGYHLINSTLPPDHIAVELDFMAALIDSALSHEIDFKESLRYQLEFLENEIFVWVFKALKKLEERTEFYRGVAKIAAAYLKFDRKLVRELMLWND